MTIMAAIFMSVALLFVVALVSWCYFQVLTKPKGKPGADSGRSGDGD